MNHNNLQKLARSASVIVFGVVFPLLMLFQAYAGISALRTDVAYSEDLDGLVQNFEKVQPLTQSANDYALYSLLYVEHANQKTMINKQVMKSIIVLVGFAVISVGLMFVLLGIEIEVGGQTEASVAFSDLSFNMKTGSAGVAVFIVGAVMATLGGVLRNEYQTSEIPRYVSGADGLAHEKSLAAYKACASQDENMGECFVQFYYQINEERLK